MLRTKMHSQLHWLHLEKRICESLAFLQNCICSYIGCICKKKTSQCQWFLANQDNRIGFIDFGVCLDLLGPKFLMRPRRLKKGARRAPRLLVLHIFTNIHIKALWHSCCPTSDLSLQMCKKKKTCLLFERSLPAVSL